MADYTWMKPRRGRPRLSGQLIVAISPHKDGRRIFRLTIATDLMAGAGFVAGERVQLSVTDAGRGWLRRAPHGHMLTACAANKEVRRAVTGTATTATLQITIADRNGPIVPQATACGKCRNIRAGDEGIRFDFPVAPEGAST